MNSARLIGACLVLGFLFSSCIPIKEMIFVEKQNADGEPMAYTSARQEYVYKLRARDVVDIQLTETVSMGEQFQLSGSLPTTNASGGARGRSYIINDDGNVTLPELGAVHVEGLSLIEARLEIEKRTEGYIAHPIVKVQLNSYVVKVLGEVNLPGAYQVRTDEPTLFEVIGLANGLTNYAKRKEVQIIRSTGTEMEIEYVDITDPEFLNSRFYYVHPGDVIAFKPLPAKRFSDNSATYALSLLSTLAVLFNVLTR